MLVCVLMSVCMCKKSAAPTSQMLYRDLYIYIYITAPVWGAPVPPGMLIRIDLYTRYIYIDRYTYIHIYKYFIVGGVRMCVLATRVAGSILQDFGQSGPPPVHRRFSRMLSGSSQQIVKEQAAAKQADTVYIYIYIYTRRPALRGV